MTMLAAPIALISPYGGRLIDLLIPAEERSYYKEYASRLPSIQMSERTVCDFELLATGALSPLDRFMTQTDYATVIHDLRLRSGHIFPIPITLPVDDSVVLHLDQDVALRDARNNLFGIMKVEEIYSWDRDEAMEYVLGTHDLRHPLVTEMQHWGRRNVSGQLRVLQLPQHYDFQELRLTPAQTRARLERLGRANVVAFQTRNPLHRAHEELTKRATQQRDAVLLLHPVIGLTKPGDVDHFTRVRTYKALAQHYFDPDRIVLAGLPLAMRMAGPREALWHAVIRRNYGANYLIVGRDHASPGLASTGQPFYGQYDAQELVAKYADELGVQPIPFQELVYVPHQRRFEEVSKIAPDTPVASLSGTQVRDNYLSLGKWLPTWFTRPEVAAILRETYPPKYQQGACIWFTGLSGAGKSTTADVLAVLLLEYGRRVTLLDGDVVRTHLSKGLTFSKEDRDINVRRIGFVAAEIVRHGGLVLCAAVSPYRAARNDVRSMFAAEQFIEVFIDTPLDVCEQRDIKGMYAKARRGEITGFTGIDDPYEIPDQPELHLGTLNDTPESNARRILAFLMVRGFVRRVDSEPAVGAPTVSDRANDREQRRERHIGHAASSSALVADSERGDGSTATEGMTITFAREG